MPSTPVDSTDARLRTLADSLDCLTEQDFILLTKTTPGTVKAWRSRGQGPDYILVGNRYLYPRQAVAVYLASSVRQQAGPEKAPS